MSSYWYQVGHVTDQQALTGCTAIIFDQPAPAVVDVRGGAPGTRETTLLGPGQHGKVDAISLSGGSAFGLSTADGIMRYLGELGRGFPTAVRPVPLVPAAIIFDLAVGDPIHPDADWAYRAARAAAGPRRPQRRPHRRCRGQGAVRLQLAVQRIQRQPLQRQPHRHSPHRRLGRQHHLRQRLRRQLQAGEVRRHPPAGMVA